MEPPDIIEPPSLTKLKEAIVLALQDGDAVFSPDPTYQFSHCNAEMRINGKRVVVCCERGSEMVSVDVELPSGLLTHVGFDSDEVADAFWASYEVFWKDEPTRIHGRRVKLGYEADAAVKALGL